MKLKGDIIFGNQYLNSTRDALHLLIAFAEGDPNTVFGPPEEIAYDHKDQWIKDSKKALKIINKQIIKLHET